MKQIIEIEVPDGKKAVWKDNKIVFEDVKSQLPKTWEEFCKSSSINRQYFISVDSKILYHKKKYRYSTSDRNLLPSFEAAKQHLALMQLRQLRDCYRQGWLPNWNENSTIKYYIGHCRAESYCVYTSRISSAFLSFQSIELTEEFLNNFRELIEQAGDLI